MPKSTASIKTCLVIDDEAFTLSIVGAMIRDCGVPDVRLVEGVQAALDAMEADGVPEIIVCDINMPGVDGIGFLRILAARAYSGGIILMSAEDKRILEAARLVGRTLNLNILDALVKPLEQHHMATLLREAGPRTNAPRHPLTPEVTAEDLAAALDGGRISTVFQPKAAVASGQILGVEALARWHDPVRGAIPPDVFIPVAEASGLISRLTERVLQLAAAQAQAWKAAGLDLRVAVNVSMEDLTRIEFVDFVIRTITGADLELGRFTLEITESRLISDMTAPLEILSRLRLNHVALSIDDFGTGHASLEQLRRIPFTELKIDRSFVHGAARDEISHSILEASVRLAKRLGMNIVAEGVETREDWTLVASYGVDEAQGYYLCRPLPAERLEAWLAENRGTFSPP